MFTGIVEHVGTVLDVKSLDVSDSGGSGWSVTVGDAEPVLKDCHLGDSISINGVCLTVTEFDQSSFKVGLSPETLRRTNLGDLKVDSKINLERAMSASKRFGGHVVQGHVDTTARVTSWTPEGNSLWLRLTLDDASSYLRYVIPKGFVAVDGISLTVCEVDDAGGWFSVMLVAYTQSHVTLPQKSVGARVNIEVDMLGKYVERIVSAMLTSTTDGKGSEGETTTGESYLERIVRRHLDERNIKG